MRVARFIIKVQKILGRDEASRAEVADVGGEAREGPDGAVHLGGEPPVGGEGVVALVDLVYPARGEVEDVAGLEDGDGGGRVGPSVVVAEGVC